MKAKLKGSTLSVGGILIGAAVCACLLAGPATTIAASYVNDLFIYLDGAHRIASGQVPNRDFHTALGPLTFYIPAFGYWLSGSMGGAMPFGMALTTLILALPIAHVIGSRLQPLIAIPYGLFLILVLAVPTNFGESVSALSFAMFYNRIGWAALGALLVMYLRPEKSAEWQEMLDAICATALTLVMLYTKITYGFVALAFLGLLLLDSRQRRWASISIGLILICSLIVEAFWQSTLAHAQDLLLTNRVSGSTGHTSLLATLVRNLFDFSLFAILSALILWRTRSVRDLLFFGFCILPGIMLQKQNAQPWGVLTLHAGAVVAAQMLLRAQERTSPPGRKFLSLKSGVPLLIMVLILPPLLQCFTALGLHTTMAVAKSGKAFDLPRFQDIRLIAPWLSDEKTLMHTYLASIEEGARALESLPEKPTNVSVLDFANPFSAGLGLPPPRGDNAWLHWGRNINEAYFPEAEQYFADVEVLMVPKWGINNIPLRGLYQSYIDTAFEPLQETEGWIVYRRKGDELAAKLRS
jgi:hypothetical protein